MTVSPIPRRQSQAVEFRLGSSPAVRPDGEFEATLVMSPGEAPRVRLSQLGWGVGVGWYAQRSFELSLSEAHQIAALLEKAPRAAEPDAEIGVAPVAAAAREPLDFAAARARRAGRHP